MAGIRSGVSKANFFHFQLAELGFNCVLEHELATRAVAVVDDNRQQLIGDNAVPSDRQNGVRSAAKSRGRPDMCRHVLRRCCIYRSITYHGTCSNKLVVTVMVAFSLVHVRSVFGCCASVLAIFASLYFTR